MTNAERAREISGFTLTPAQFMESDFTAVHAFASDPLVCEHTTSGPNAEARHACLHCRDDSSEGRWVSTCSDAR